MKIDRRVIHGGIVFATVFALTVTAYGAQSSAVNVEHVTVQTQEVQSGETTTAGVCATFGDSLSELSAGSTTAGATELVAEAVANATETDEDSIATEATDVTDSTEAADASESGDAYDWDSTVMANVEDYVNVREEADEDSEIVGRLSKGDAAEILEAGEEWTKISSGNVEGYVSNDYLAFGDDAEALAEETGTYVVTVNTETLRVRSEASTDDTDIVDLVASGDALEMDTDADEVDGWVAVSYDGETAYVSAEYVTVSLELGEGQTTEEVEAEEAASEESSTTTSSSSTSVSSDDVTLLAALIYCEAGGESYAGQVAVGAVVMNRVNSSSYPNTISGVIYQSGQFGPASSGKLARVLANGSYTSSCYQAAQEALSGTSNVGSATSFASASSGKSGTVIGNHVFY